MSYNPHKAPKRAMLCAVRFLALTANSTFRASAREIAREQGPTSAELDKAEREMIRAGWITKSGGLHPTLSLTAKGREISRSQCRGVSLAPWDWRATYPRESRRRTSVQGASRRRSRR